MKHLCLCKLRVRKELSLLVLFILSAVSCMSLLTSCASDNIKGPEKTGPVAQNTEHIKEPPAEARPAEQTAPEFVPIKEDLSPLRNRTISISARNTPLRDVLYTIARTASLNLAMERSVNPELPVTVAFTNLAIEDALNVILDSADYFYSVRDNLLTIKAVDTKIFEFSQPGVINEYSTDIGGDILGGASEGGSAIKGNIAMKSTTDKISFQFWDALENSLKSLIPASAGAETQAGFTINRMAGTIMVTAAKKDMRRIEDFISNLNKVLNRQVMIEARIVEVQLSDELKYGIDWSAVSTWKGIGDITVGANKFNTVVSSSRPNLQIGLTGTDFTSVLTALQQQGEVRTLSNPRVNILNGQTALLSDGRNTSFISRVETTTTTTEGSAPTTTFTVETRSILSGIIFGLVPYINGQGQVTLTISPIVSNLVELNPQTIGTGSSQVEIKLPVVDLRELSTTIRLQDNQMIIIGGLIDRKERLKENKVPLLGDLPFIKHLFTSVDKTMDNTELVIMLTPKLALD